MPTGCTEAQVWAFTSSDSNYYAHDANNGKNNTFNRTYLRCKFSLTNATFNSTSAAGSTNAEIAFTHNYAAPVTPDANPNQRYSRLPTSKHWTIKFAEGANVIFNNVWIREFAGGTSFTVRPMWIYILPLKTNEATGTTTYADPVVFGPNTPAFDRDTLLYSRFKANGSEMTDAEMEALAAPYFAESGATAELGWDLKTGMQNILDQIYL